MLPQRGNEYLGASLLALAALSPALTLADATAPQLEFNPAFLQGASQLDVSHFSRGNPVLPGEYLVDLDINNKWVGRMSVRFIAQPNSDVALPCIDRALIGRLGLDFGSLSETAHAELQKAQAGSCADLKAMITDAEVSFDLSQLRLDISVPQAAMLHRPRGYVASELWDTGVPSGTLGYNLNVYRSATNELTTTDGHLDLSAGLNLGSWHLRQRSSLEMTSGGPTTYQNIATYIAHDIPSIRGDLTIGDSFTDGAVFDSFGYRGVSLATDDQMLPDSQLEYAPVVHGIAHTNARVVITQNGNTILETTVSPGAFEINDLYATGYGGDLHVTVYEADGSQEGFAVPYASLVQLLRPGVWRYTAVAGEVEQASVSGRGWFTQATLQHGFNNIVTGYTGVIAADHYDAGLAGIAVNTLVGAIAVDLTEANAGISSHYSATGESLRVSYSKLVRASQTNITLSTYRYSSTSYYSFSDAQDTRQTALADLGATDGAERIARARGEWQVNINQTLPGRWGNFFLSGSLVTYWNSPGTATEFQTGYTNHFRVGRTSVSFSATLAHQRNELTGAPETRAELNFSVPLGRSPHAPTLSTNLIQDASDGTETRSGQEVLAGTWGANNQGTYSATASEGAGNNLFAANGQYRSSFASVSTGFSEGSNYSQQSLGATGGLVVHPGGITFANQMTDTIGLVEAIGAQGARVTNSLGTVINRSGYAVLPFLLPYRLNSINIDPDGTASPDVEFKNTSLSVAPRLNSVVMIRFQTVGGRPILATARLVDGSVVPFGASVFDADQGEVGLVGQDGRIYLRGIAAAGTLTAIWGNGAGQQCSFQYQLPTERKDDDPFVRFEATCAVGAVAAPKSSDDVVIKEIAEEP